MLIGGVGCRAAFGRVVLTSAALLLAGCASKPLNVPYNPANFGAPDAAPVVPVAAEIAPGDKLKITVFQVDALSGEFQVETNGEIDFPQVGVVQAQGHTPTEFAQLLAAKLAERTLKNPNVQVAVTERAPRTITIEGAVKQAAVVPVPGKTTLLQAIALGGGTSEDAKVSQVVVFRTIKGERMAAAYDLRAISRAEAPDPVIYPNDIVVVAGSHNKKVVDTVLRSLSVLGMFRPF
jgi:polysaccharide export outer membrane protein